MKSELEVLVTEMSDPEVTKGASIRIKQLIEGWRDRIEELTKESLPVPKEVGNWLPPTEYTKWSPVKEEEGE